MRVACSVEIDRPAREVWAYVADYGNDTRWRAGVSQLRPSRPGPAQAGVTTHEALRLLGATFRADATIHRVDAGRLLEWRAHDRQKDLQGSRLVDPTGGGGARFTEVVDLWLLGPLRPLGPLVAWLSSGEPRLTCGASSGSWRRRRAVGHHRRPPRHEAGSNLPPLAHDRSAAPRHGGHRCPSGCGSALHEQLSLFGEPLFGELEGMPAR